MNEQREDDFTIDENKVKDALVGLAQQKVAEISQQNLILQANYQVMLAERVQLPELIAENNELKQNIEDFADKNKLDISKLREEQIKSKAELEHATTDMQNMVNKIDTFYKPRIRELENEVKELKELLPEDNNKPTKK